MTETPLPEPAPKRSRVRFLILFIVLVVAFQLPLASPTVYEVAIVPFTRVLATISAFFLEAIQHNVRVANTAILGDCFGVDIKNGCTGLEATMLLVAALLAFPFPMKARITGAIAGFFFIQSINIVRIVSLYLLGCHKREWFSAAHVQVWQTIIFAVTLLFFLFWTKRYGTLGKTRS